MKRLAQGPTASNGNWRLYCSDCLCPVFFSLVSVDSADGEKEIRGLSQTPASEEQGKEVRVPTEDPGFRITERGDVKRNRNYGGRSSVLSASGGGKSWSHTGGGWFQVPSAAPGWRAGGDQALTYVEPLEPDITKLMETATRHSIWGPKLAQTAAFLGLG